MFVNDQRKDECILEDAYVLVSDTPINNILNIENVLKPVINGGKPLVIIADCSDAVQMTLAANVVKNGLKFCVVQPPSFGWRRQEQMGDLAFMLGGKYFSEQTGDDLSIATVGDLGIARRIVVGREETIVVRPDSDDEKFKSRVAELWEQHKNMERNDEREFILERIASLSGGMSVIYVGANTDVEQKELYDRVDDAVCAVRSALEDGVLSGGGVALRHIAETMELPNGVLQKSLDVFRVAIKAPLRQIVANSGQNWVEVEKNIANCGPNFGFDVKNGKYGNMMEMGIIDPAKVTKNALVSATSVAVTLLGTNAIVTNESSK
jgi:chaperonin GroEL